MTNTQRESPELELESFLIGAVVGYKAFSKDDSQAREWYREVVKPHIEAYAQATAVQAQISEIRRTIISVDKMIDTRYQVKDGLGRRIRNALVIRRKKLEGEYTA